MTRDHRISVATGEAVCSCGENFGRDLNRASRHPKIVARREWHRAEEERRRAEAEAFTSKRLATIPGGGIGTGELARIWNVTHGPALAWLTRQERLGTVRNEWATKGRNARVWFRR